MKKITFSALFFFFAINLTFSQVVIDIDGNVYHTVTIGTQVWMTENLKTSHYRNGDSIPNVTDANIWDTLITGAYINNFNGVGTYGCWYNWYSVSDSRNIAPIGWHIPSDSEWLELSNYLGGGTVSGGEMKTTGTMEAGTGLWASPNTGADNSSGFSGIPGGKLNTDSGKFVPCCSTGQGFFVSSTPYRSYMRGYFLQYNNASSGFDLVTRQVGYSVRCIKDTLVSTVIYPKLLSHTSSINAGQSIAFNGTGFTPNDTATLSISGAGGFSQNIGNISINAQGEFTYNLETAAAMQTGLYYLVATDKTSGLTTPLKSFYLTGINVANYLQIICPLIGSSVDINQNFNIEWKDKLILGSGYTVTGAKRNYKYTIEYADNGGAWQNIGVVEGQDYVDTYVSLSKQFAFIASSDNMQVRITDFYNPSNVKVSPIFIVSSATANNLQVNLNWDFSYPYSTAPVQGVAADGTARIFMNLSKIAPTGPNISSVSVTLSDAFNGTNATRLGRVKTATQTTAYSSEANGVNIITATDNIANKTNYIFWYVAPDDFVGNDVQDSIASFRYVNALFNVTYIGGTTAAFTKKIKIVRPPVMLVHGLGGDASTWDDFAHTEFGPPKKFTEDYRFVTCKAVNIDPTAAFKTNALNMTIGLNNSDPNTFQGVINNIRNQGYAANRVDYVCHSMGGCVLRSIFDNYYALFARTGTYANRSAKNYERGYVNKVIMLDVPNNSSPWADIVNRYVSDLPLIARIAIQGWYGYTAQEITFPLMFIKPIDPNALLWTYKPTDAVRDLQINEGINFGITNAKAHLIAGDFFPGTQLNTDGLIPQEVINYIKNSGDNTTPEFLNYFLKIASNLETDPELRSELLNIIKNDTDPFVSAFDFLDKLAKVMDAFNVGTFIPESDLIVSVQSQLAGHSKGDPNCSSFDNFVGHALIRPITKNIDVGNRVNRLLNSSINSSLFDVIEATTNATARKIDAPNKALGQLNDNIISSRIDSSKLQLLYPQNHATINVDSVFHIIINIKDTANLLTLQVNVQNKTYKIDSIFPGTIDINIQLINNILDSQMIVLQGFYNYPDSGVFVYDEAQVNIITTDTLVSFGVNPEIMYLLKDQFKYPDYYAVYKHSVATHGNFSPNISVLINDPSVVRFDSITRGFQGIARGETYAIVTYLQLSDTLYFVVDPIENINITCPNSSTSFIVPLDAGKTYQWQVDNGNGFANINSDAIYSNATTNELSLSNPPTSWYGYKYQCVVSNGIGYSTTAPITLKFSVTWSGVSDSAWENNANWNCGIMPDSNTDVIVNAGSPKSPNVNSNTSCRSINLNAGAMLKVKTGYKLAINGKNEYFKN